MAEERVELTAIIRAVPGKHEALKTALAALVAQTVQEPGCREFRIFEDREDRAIKEPARDPRATAPHR